MVFSNNDSPGERPANGTESSASSSNSEEAELLQPLVDLLLELRFSDSQSRVSSSDPNPAQEDKPSDEVAKLVSEAVDSSISDSSRTSQTLFEATDAKVKSADSVIFRGQTGDSTVNTPSPNPKTSRTDQQASPPASTANTNGERLLPLIAKPPSAVDVTYSVMSSGEGDGGEVPQVTFPTAKDALKIETTTNPEQKSTLEREETTDQGSEALGEALEPLQNSIGDATSEQKSTFEKEDTSAEESQEFGEALEQLQNLIVGATSVEKQASTGTVMQDHEQDPLEALQQLMFGSTLSDFEQLRSSLLDSELPNVKNLMERIRAQLGSLEYQIYEPQQLKQLLFPWIAEILTLKVTESKDDVIQALMPIIDEVIRAKGKENHEAMSVAIADLIPEAIRYQIRNSPKEIAQALGPEMGAAIREQIRVDRNEIAAALAPTIGRTIKEQVALERDAMVDALYPVIGSTITRYLAEAIREINEKVANALSIEGIERKVRARVRGVSEAELILQEVIPLTVNAVFLIHKASGLVIAEAQQFGNARLESEMVAGMLTAIRSFVNDCIVQQGEISELNEIEYGDSRILIEVAGYCYLAVVLKGVPGKVFLKNIRKTLAKIILKYGNIIEEFDGDSEQVPESLMQTLEDLINEGYKNKSGKSPLTILVFSSILVGLIAIPFGIYQYRSQMERRIEIAVRGGFDREPELSVYRLGVDAQKDSLTLSGKLPNARLRDKAVNIAQEIAPHLTLNNQIIAVNLPADPIEVKAEVERVAKVLNQVSGISILARYQEEQVLLSGTVIRPQDIEKVTQAFRKIKGINSVVSTVKIQPFPIPTRLYFNQNSEEFLDQDLKIKILPVAKFMRQYPDVNLRIIGYQDAKEKLRKNSNLPLERSQAVQTILEDLGIDRRRLQAVGESERPPGVAENQPLWLSRTVLFEIIPGS